MAFTKVENIIVPTGEIKQKECYGIACFAKISLDSGFLEVAEFCAEEYKEE